mmetsp:Transcript_46457/g.109355  ORF Transcript_46457/g.109355 Transcript_46457/m.109355 type:complete len:83 (-) Transcript_46457:105-353(-)
MVCKDHIDHQKLGRGQRCGASGTKCAFLAEREPTISATHEVELDRLVLSTVHVERRSVGQLAGQYARFPMARWGLFFSGNRL